MVGRGAPDPEVPDGDGVAHPEAGVVIHPGPGVVGVQQTVGEQDEVSDGH